MCPTLNNGCVITQKVSKETLALKCMLDQIDLTDTHSAFHPIAADNTFFSSAYEIFSGQILCWATKKKSLNKFKKTEIKYA